MGETIVNLLRVIKTTEDLERMQLEYPFPLEILGEIDEGVWDQLYEKFIWKFEIEKGKGWFKNRTELLEQLIVNVIQDEKSRKNK